MDKWKTLGSKLIYTNPYYTLIEEDVVRPNGNRAPYYILERPHFSIIIPITAENDTYLVGQYRYAVSEYSWEFPMGAVSNKSSLEIAKIELSEETGLLANDWKRIGKLNIAPGYSRQKAYVYLAKQLTQRKSHPEQNEFLKVKKISLSKVRDLIANGKILDGPTICAYYFLEIYLKNL